MLTLVKDLQASLQEKLEAVDVHSNATKGFKAKSQLVEEAITEMKKYLLAHPFPNKGTEIEYFKHWLPSFTKLHLYFLALSDLEFSRQTHSPEDFLKHLEKEKERIASFFQAYRDLYYYHMSGETEEDDRLFVRDPVSGRKDFLEKDGNFCHHSLVLGWLLAYEEYTAVLEREIGLHASFGRPNLAPPDKKTPPRLQWAGTKTELVELIIVFFEGECIHVNGRPATIEQLRRWAEQTFNIDLKDFAVLENAIRNRKGTPSIFLDKLRKILVSRRERLDP